MPRNYNFYLKDILSASNKILKYTKGLSFSAFQKDEIIVDAVARNLEIIGEASKNVPKTFRDKHPQIEWKKIAGLRDILIHEYFGIDLEILWDIIRIKVPELKKSISKIIKRK